MEDAREYVERMDPHHQEERDRWLFEKRHDFEPWREGVRRGEEEQRAYAEKSRQRDRELLESNRASVGLPPLTSAQISGWGLEGTTWGRAVADASMCGHKAGWRALCCGGWGGAEPLLRP
ncbi:MAG: hypothetical protein ACRDTR_16510, partial [Rubrobacter sp.]